MEKIIINTDGGAKGNPGPAAVGVVIKIDGKEKTYNKKLGKTTNNIAEYEGAIFALKKLKQLIGRETTKKSNIELRMDSQLVVNQIKGKYKIKEEGLKNFFIELWNLRQDFNNVEFKLVPREKNQKADKLVKDILNTLI